jgi:hypothetical protein
MSFGPQENARRIVFVSRYMVGESLRSARALRRLDRVRLFGICEQLVDDDDHVFDEMVRVDDADDPEPLIAAARELAGKHGALSLMVTAYETLLEPVALAADALGLKGMSSVTVRGVLNKERLKQTLERAGIPTARAHLIFSHDEGRRFAQEVGFPIVMKPLSGSGGLGTWSIRDCGELEVALELMEPSIDNGVLAEEYLRGQELCIDTITTDNEPRFHSICCYRPSILEALEEEQVQWSCVMPRDIDGDFYRDFTGQGLAAIRALSVGNAMTHMEGFITETGVRFTDATLRPAGARIGPMLAYAYDIDPYHAWARVAVDGSFDGPWERRYSVGTIFLRGAGSGLVKMVNGIESVKRTIGELLVDSSLPQNGAPKSVTYTGDGYLTVRHPETRVVQDALNFISETVKITYSGPEPDTPAVKERWRERMKQFGNRMYRPAWDNEALSVVSDASRVQWERTT